MKKHNFSHFIDDKLTGVTSVGERGQVVIPAKIRRHLKLKKGERLFVFAKSSNFIGLVKIGEFSKLLKKIIAKIEGKSK